MVRELDQTVTDFDVLSQGFILRDGFAFILGDKPAVYDTLLIRWPPDAVGTPKFARSNRTLEEHVQLINQYRLENARIICRDLSFITQCPSLSKISIHPDDMGTDNFDYSPLYAMPNLNSVCCATQYGIREQYRTNIDYSKLSSLKEVSIAGTGHKGYELLASLQYLWLSNNNKHQNFMQISCSAQLQDIRLQQTALRSLNGIENHPQMQSVSLWYNRSLTDISALGKLGNTLRVLDIECCPKITDFTILPMLGKLEHLRLNGSNTLPSLAFLKEMPNLKTFSFTMNVDDGDLTFCKNIPYASCKNRKHFNIKDAQLPKNIPR